MYDRNLNAIEISFKIHTSFTEITNCFFTIYSVVLSNNDKIAFSRLSQPFTDNNTLEEI